LKDQTNQLQRLLEKSEWTTTEMEWLLNYLENSDDRQLKQIMQGRFVNDIKNSHSISKQSSEKLLKVIHGKIDMEKVKSASPVVSLRKIAVAVSIVGLIVVTAIILMNKNSSAPIVKAQNNDRKFKNDVDPGGNKATLTLADGSVISLDDAKNGTLTQQGNARVIKLDGKLLYDPTSNNTKQIVYNTISTPKGGQYQLELPDGSLVWLNATSSVRFPTTFTDKERRVEIMGEAYFEVAKDANKPFIVSVNNSEVQVLGTHFNINAYDDEEEVRTTLLEGSVKFVNANINTILKPGQQSRLTKEGNVNVASNVDVDDVIAWKNGRFNFDNAGIESVMRQLTRWYDVEVDYKGKTDDLFIAEMRRDIKLSDALKALELTGKVKFEIDGRKIIVMP
jgi:ferric-dicitrate binding protein FerR (iron transport regulator)